MSIDPDLQAIALPSLIVTHPVQREGRIDGFRFLWAYYVRGYHPDRHCQPCFIGQRVTGFHTRTARVHSPVRFDKMGQYPFVYVCGVAAGPTVLRRDRNLHMALVHEPGTVADVTTYNGYRIRIDNARQLHIPPLPDGWQGRPDVQVRCRNYQFAVAYLSTGDTPTHG